MDFPALLHAFARAVEAGDGAALAALFREDGCYADTFYGEHRGRAAIRDMLEGMFHRDGEGFRWAFRDPVCDGRRGYARWRFSYTSRLPESAGRRVAVEGMSCFELEGGAIVRYDEVFDAGQALAQLGFTPERLARLLARWAETARARPGMAPHLAPPKELPGDEG